MGHFLGVVTAQSSRREASTQPFFDRLDIFSIICDAIETLDSSKITLEPLYKNEKQIRSAGVGGTPHNQASSRLRDILINNYSPRCLGKSGAEGAEIFWDVIKKQLKIR